MNLPLRSSSFALFALLSLSACSGGAEEMAYVPPTESELISYLNSSWGEPACTKDGCFSFRALSAASTEKPWIWCANIESINGTPFYDNDGFVARIAWNEAKISKTCYRVATSENGIIQYIEATK